MALTVTRQTREADWNGSYVFCHGCGEAADHGTVIAGDASLKDVHSADPRWIRLCDRCLAALEAWLAGPRVSTILIP